MVQNVETIAISITGRVQGVGFRASARREAEKLGLLGFIRNEADGTVYAEIHGPKEAIDSFLEWCRRGPSFAKVDSVDIKELPQKEFLSFQIER